MNNFMLYLMVGSILLLFAWAAFEYAKAGVQFWREQHRQGDKSTSPQEAKPPVNSGTMEQSTISEASSSEVVTGPHDKQQQPMSRTHANDHHVPTNS